MYLLIIELTPAPVPVPRFLNPECRPLKNMAVKSAKELKVYQLSYELGMMIFDLSKSFPA
tara:strand:- start:4218 stop:4397 length:180 start_codon:yes stop_codon:yes gene_type:complete